VGYDIDTVKENTRTVIDATKEGCLEVKAEKSISSSECRAKSGHKNNKQIV
jgi:hypothetical protein